MRVRRTRAQIAADAAAAAGTAAAAVITEQQAATEEAPEQRDVTSEQEQATDTLAEMEGSRSRLPVAKLYRVDPETRKEYLFDEVAPGVVNESFLLKQYGGGTFVVSYWGPTDKYKGKKWGYLRREMIELDPSVPFRPPTRGEPKTGRVYNQDGTEAGAGGFEEIRQTALLGMLRQMQDASALTARQAADHGAAMLAMVERMAQQPRGPDILAVVTALAPIVTPMITGLMSRKDPMEMARQIAELMKSGGAAPQSSVDQVKQFLELRNLLKGDDDGGRGDGESWESMGPKLIANAMELLKAESAKTPAPPPARVAARTTPLMATPVHGVSGPLPTPSVAVGADGSGGSSGEAPVSDQWTALEPYVGRLAQFAAQGKDPFSVVKMVTVMASPQTLGMIRELVARDDAAAALCERFPALAPYQAWTNDLVEYFYSEFHPGEARESSDPMGAEGDGE